VTQEKSGSSTLDSVEGPKQDDLGWLQRIIGLLNRDSTTFAILLLLALLAFSPWWLGGRLFAPLDLLDGLYEPWHDPATPIEVKNHFTSDGVTQYLVYRGVAERSFAEDGRIGWSELTQGGRPEYANTMAGYDDWSMLLHRFFPFWTGWHLGLLGQFLIAGAGMLVFLRGQRISPLVALAGGIAYAANSQFIYFFFHRWHLGAFAWVPWMAWALYRYRAGHRWAWPLVPLFLALAFLGGSLQTSAFVGLTLLALWLGWVTERPARAEAAASIERPERAEEATSFEDPPRSRRWLSATGHLLAWTILGAGLAGFALYPSIITLVEGLELGLDRGGIGYERGVMQPVLSALLIALQPVPSLLGSPRSMDLAKALGLELPAIAYFGFIPMVLAYRAALMRGAPAAARWLIALGILLPLTPLVGPLYHRVQLLFCFGGVWAFAWYWEHADRERVDPVLRRVAQLGLAFVVLWLLGSMASHFLEGKLQGKIDGYIAGRVAGGEAGQFGSYREAWFLERGRLLLPELRLWHPRQVLVVLTAALGFAALRLRTRRGVGPAALLLLAGLVLELGFFAGGWVTTVDPAEHPPYAESPDITALRQEAGEGRVYIVDDAAAPSFFPPNTLAMYGVATIQGYETVGFRNMWSEAEYTDDAAKLGEIGVTHAVSRPEVGLPAGWTPEYRGERLIIWRNEHALPRYLALSAGLSWVPGEGGDLAAVAAIGAVQSTGTQNQRRLEVPSGTGTVRIAENWGEGWRYRVEGGEWRQVEMAADRSMLLPLEQAPLTQQVELEYRPRRRIIGWWLTLTAAILTALGTIVTSRHSQSASNPASAVGQQRAASVQY
jgi:hypothetical protein